MIDMEEYTDTVVALAVELCVNWTYEEREDVFGMGSVPRIFKTHTVRYIEKMIEEESMRTYSVVGDVLVHGYPKKETKKKGK